MTILGKAGDHPWDGDQLRDAKSPLDIDSYYISLTAYPPTLSAYCLAKTLKHRYRKHKDSLGEP